MLSLGLLSGTLLGAAAQGAEAPCDAPNTVRVEAANAATTVAVGGSVVSERRVTLTAQLPARVEAVAGDEGDRFAAGSVLVELDVDDLLAQRRAAQAQVASATAALRNAGVQLDRERVSPQVAQSPGGMGMPAMMDQMFMNPMQSMMGTRRPGAERSAELHARQTQVEQARQALLAAQSDIERIDSNLRDARSLAPFDGVITLRHVEVGDPVQPGQPLVEFIDPTQLQIRVDVPARLRTRLEEGMELSARLDMAARPIPVTLARIFPTADAARHTVRMELDLPPDITPPVGSYAEVLFPDPAMPDRPTLSIPATAVVTRGGLQMVYEVDSDYRAQLRFVRTGRRLDSGEVRVLSGLEGGECIVADPRPGLASGDLITP